jgi:hypothetical protein
MSAAHNTTSKMQSCTDQVDARPQLTRAPSQGNLRAGARGGIAGPHAAAVHRPVVRGRAVVRVDVPKPREGAAAALVRAGWPACRNHVIAVQ